MQTEKLKKVVAHLKDGSLVKGYLESDVELQPLHSSTLHRTPLSGQVSLHVCSDTGADVELAEIALENTKALFFVQSFEGNKDYREVKFFSSVPTVEGLWVQVTFYDTEMIEGIVQNSPIFVINPGFFMKPPDPFSNNRMIYVVKDSMKDFRVIGVKNEY